MYPLLEEGLNSLIFTPRGSGLKTALKPGSGSLLNPLVEEGLNCLLFTPMGSGPKNLLMPGSGSLVNPTGFAPATAGNVLTSIDVEAMAIKVLMVRVMSIKKAIGGRGGLSAAHTIPGFNY